MPVQSEKDWVHIRLKKSLAKQLRVLAKREHRYGIQVEANLAVETYIRKSLGMVVYGVFKKNRCIYVGATNNLCHRATAHWHKFGSECRIEIFAATTSFDQVKLIESTYIRKFKEIGQADFNLNENGSPNQKFDRLVLDRIRKLQFKDDGK